MYDGAHGEIVGEKSKFARGNHNSDLSATMGFFSFSASSNLCLKSTSYPLVHLTSSALEEFQ